MITIVSKNSASLGFGPFVYLKPQTDGTIRAVEVYPYVEDNPVIDSVFGEYKQTIIQKRQQYGATFGQRYEREYALDLTSYDPKLVIAVFDKSFTGFARMFPETQAGVEDMIKFLATNYTVYLQVTFQYLADGSYS